MQCLKFWGETSWIVTKFLLPQYLTQETEYNKKMRPYVIMK